MPTKFGNGIDLGGQRIRNIGTATASTDAVTKAQLDAVGIAADRETLIYSGSAYPTKTKPYADYQGPVEPTMVNGDTWFDTTPSLVVLGADVTNNNATLNTLQDVTGLSFELASGQRYYFEFVIAYTAQATATGSRWAVNGPSFSFLAYDSTVPTTTTAQTINRGLGAYNLPAASNASSPSTSGNLARVEGIIVTSAVGTLQLRFASEIASSAIVAKAGSFGRLLKL